MTDIVERIRSVFDDSEEIAGFLSDDDAYEYKEAGVHLLGLYKSALEAADEIERLRKRVVELEASDILDKDLRTYNGY